MSSCLKKTHESEKGQKSKIIALEMYCTMIWLFCFKKIHLGVIHKDCSIKFRSKHSTVLLLCLLRNLMEQMLVLFETVPWDVNDSPNNQTAKHNEANVF